MIPLPAINSDGSYTTHPCGMAIDADGANGQSSPPVYAPVGFQPAPLDYLANAGGPGNWYGVVTDHLGNPVVQGVSDPMPGAYVSATSYKRKGFMASDPLAYVDANAVIFIVLPSHWRAQAAGVVLGCRAEVHDLETGKAASAVVADFGPKGKIGEASIACARFFGVPESPKNGGTEKLRFVYSFWPGQAAPGFELQPLHG